MANTSFNTRHGQPISQTSPAQGPSPAPFKPRVVIMEVPADDPRTGGAGPTPAAGAAQQVEVTPVIPPALSAAEQLALALALSPSQLTAIEQMLSGHTLVAAANAAGITRMTLYNWLHHDAKFQAAYNAWQLDAVTRMRTKLLSISDIATNTVSQAVRSDARLAFAVLKELGGLDRPTPGSTDPEEVEQVMEIEQRKAEERLGEQLFWASIGGGMKPPRKDKKTTNAEAEELLREMEKEMARKAAAGK
jgi:transcriptional regulator with XRE-family HTH domain